MEFRRSLASSFLFRMMVFVSAQLEAAQAPGFTSSFSGCDASAAQPFERPAAQGLQYFAKTPGEAAVGQPHRHMAADLQVRGWSATAHLFWAALHTALPAENPDGLTQRGRRGELPALFQQRHGIRESSAPRLDAAASHGQRGTHLLQSAAC